VQSNLFSLFQSKRIDEIARLTGFLKRKSKFTPQAFIDLMFFAVSSNNPSLQQIVKEAPAEHSITLSKQGLDSRFSPQSVAFSKSLLEEAIAKQVLDTPVFNSINKFNRIQIKDSTKFNISELFKEDFPGSGGSGSTAGVSIQFEYDLKSGKIADIDLQAANKSDSKDALKKKDQIQASDLIIRDLGYYSDKVINTICDNDAYFISRLCYSSNVYETQKAIDQIDFGLLYRQMQNAGIEYKELKVFVGEKRIPLRLVIALLPEAVREKRIRIRNKVNKKRKQNTTDKFRARAHFNLFICNISPEDLTKEEVCNLYHVRWQIELIFKTWKSLMKINQLQKMKLERFVTTIYMNLLWIVVFWNIIYPYNIYQSIKEKRLISFFKCMNTLVDSTRDIRQLLRKSQCQMRKKLRKIYDIFSTGHWLEKRKDGNSYENIFSLLFW